MRSRSGTCPADVWVYAHCGDKQDTMIDLSTIPRHGRMCQHSCPQSCLVKASMLTSLALCCLKVPLWRELSGRHPAPGAGHHRNRARARVRLRRGSPGHPARPVRLLHKVPPQGAPWPSQLSETGPVLSTASAGRSYRKRCLYRCCTALWPAGVGVTVVHSPRSRSDPAIQQPSVKVDRLLRDRLLPCALDELAPCRTSLGLRSRCTR